MMQTSTRVFHVTDGEASCRTSTCELQLTRRIGGAASCRTSTCELQLTRRIGGAAGVQKEWRTELRSNIDESPDTVLGLVLASDTVLGLVLALRLFGGIWRIHGVVSMLLVFGGKLYAVMPRAGSVSENRATKRRFKRSRDYYNI